ncbi:hypothetical protein KR038_005553, partial [Drosophila bunnanda]
RPRSILKFKKYIFMFFALLLAIIWVNHYTKSKSSRKVPIEDLPAVENKSHEELIPTPRTESPQEKRLRLFRERLFDDDKEHKVTTTEQPYNLEETDYDVDLSEIQRSRRKRKKATSFFVMNPMCKIPYVDPFSKDALAILKPVPLDKCSKEGPIFELKFVQKLQRYRLRVNTTMLAKLVPNLPKYICKYREVTNDTISLWKTFENEAVIDWIPSGIVAECHVAQKGLRTIQEDAFPLVQMPYRRVHVESDPLKKRPSVLILGLESVSRMNFKRNMPKTAEFVEQEGWFELKGYNKVGDGAFSNLCAILGGAKSDVTCEQRFPLIWQAFRKAGYTTAFGEDSLESSVPSGFSTDYQFRTLLEDIGQSMGSVTRFGRKYCIGRRPSASYLLDFCLQFAQRVIVELDQPALGLFWSSTFTSDYRHGPTSLDERLVEFFRSMSEHHVLERSIVILLSDQGQMSGDLVNLPDGYLEERLPMMHIHLPPWFREAYPRFAGNLQDNRNRLTSPFDLHNTLRHILNLKALNPKEMVSLMSCRNTQSLLHLVPFNRSCEEACIGLHSCSCDDFELLPNDMGAYHLAKSLVSHINFWMLKKGFNLHCQRLRLSNLDYAERTFEKRNIMVVRLRVLTYPLESILSATLRYNLESGKVLALNIKDVSNLSSHSSSDCVKDRTAKKFCVC